MFSSTGARLVATTCLTAGVALVAAPAASADAIRYSVAPNPGVYTVKDNGNGLVKVSYLGCVTADQLQRLQFTFTTEVTKSSPATFKILQVKGTEPTPVFTPPTVDLVAGPPQDHTGTVGFVFDDTSQASTQFRVKLDPANGSGLGQAAGVSVDIPCILAAQVTTPPPAPAPTPSAPAPVQPMPNAPTPDPTPTAVPTTLADSPMAGYIPPPTGVLAARESKCLSVPRTLRLRAGELSVVRVTVRSDSGQRLNRALVRATYPGAVQTRRTDRNGVATFNIRARRAGRLVLQSDVCFGADRRTVLPTRQVRADRPARVTG